jgi:hypothetical protein
MALSSPLSADASGTSHRAITVRPAGPAAPAQQARAVHALLDTLDPSKSPVRRAKWRRNLGAIVPSLALESVAHITFAAYAGGTTEPALRCLAAGQLATSLGLYLFVMPALPKKRLAWTPNFCASAKWWLAGGSLLGTGLTAITQGPQQVLIVYGASLGVYTGFGASMALLGRYLKIRAQRAPQSPV